MWNTRAFRGWIRILIFAGLGIGALAMALPVRASGAVLYAAPGGLTTGACTSWATACTLSYALSIAVNGDQIWVKEGVHKPDTTGLANPRLATFSLKKGVALYGGFAGTETSLGQRSWTSRPTVLSGDIDHNDVVDANGATVTINGANAYHVVSAYNVNSTALLNGFIITGGQATDPSSVHEQGAGVYVVNASPQLSNLVIVGNVASYGGAGIYNQGASFPSLTNVVFRNNDAQTGYGGGMYNEDPSSPTLVNVSFISNTASYGGGIFSSANSFAMFLVQFRENYASYSGGGIHNDSGAIQLASATFVSNTAGAFGGGVWSYAAALTVVDSEFRGNFAEGGGGGVYHDLSEATFTNVRFVNNATLTSGGNYGGGLYNRSGAATLTNVLFEGNISSTGGGMYNYASDAWLNQVQFVNNTASAQGGGMSSIFGVSVALTDTVFIGNAAGVRGGGMHTLLVEENLALTNVLFSGNTAQQDGGGMYSESAVGDPPVAFTNVTFSDNAAQNSGGALVSLYMSNVTLTNVIIWGNTAGVSPGIANTSSSLLISHSDIQGCGGSTAWNAACGVDGGGNIDVDPLFVDADGADNIAGTPDDNLRLQVGSPAIDAGDNAAVPSGLIHDLDGNARIQDGDGDNSPVVDMGVYETADMHPPVVISSVRADANPTNAASVNFIVSFSEPVTDVDATDFNVTATGVSGAAVANVSGSGVAYTVTVSTGSGDGTLRLDVPALATIRDAMGNGLANLPYQAGETYTVDKTGPAVNLEQAAGQADPTNTALIHFTVIFNEPILTTTFSVEDVVLGWSGPGAITATVAEVAPNNGTAFQVAVSGMSGSGVVTASIPAGVIQDLIGNLNTASSSTDNSVTYWDPNADSDGDGLSDWAEVQLGANPNAADSDGDGMPDGWEVTNGLNPTNPSDASGDADGDGLSNLQEYQLGANPNAADSDGDGMPDGWEVANGLNPTNPSDADEDPDQDGRSNLQEYQSGTDPRAPEGGLMRLFLPLLQKSN